MHLSLGSHMRLNCPHCGQPEHTPECPRRKLDELMVQQRFLLCPACGKNGVDVNSQDFWECRYCHTQFSGSEVTLDPLDECTRVQLIVDLDAHWKNGIKNVYQMKTKGSGDFPTDKAIEALVKKLAASHRRRKR